MKKIFLIYPLLLLFTIYFLDKIFSLPFFMDNFVQTGNVVYYKQREILFEKLVNRKENNKKLIIAMGDSRAYSFSNLAFNDNTKDKNRKDKYDIYNFSGPQAVPAYSLFWLERMIEAGVKIDSIFLVLSPEGFDDNKGLLHKPFLRLGATDGFVNQYKEIIPSNDLDEYYLDKIFTLRKIELDYKLLITRFKNKQLNEYNPNFNQEIMILNLHNGEQLAYANVVNDEKKLASDSVRLGNIYFYNFTLHQTQFKFTEKILELCQKNKIKINLLWMKVFPTYRENFIKYNIEKDWWSGVVTLAEKYGMKAYDFNKIGNCELYYDASHQSAFCYYEYTHYLIDEMEK